MDVNVVPSSDDFIFTGTKNEKSRWVMPIGIDNCSQCREILTIDNGHPLASSSRPCPMQRQY
jgi:hypothetical protein